MRSIDVEKALQAGAKVVEKPTWHMRKKHRNLRLVWDDGHDDIIQYSTIAPLIRRGVLQEMTWSGDRYTYHYSPYGSGKISIEVRKP